MVACLAAADARALVRQALDDAQIVRTDDGHTDRLGVGCFDKNCFDNANFARIGVDVYRGDLAFVLDFNETTDQDLAAIGLSRNEALRFRTAVRALETRLTPSRFDRWYKDGLKLASPLRRTLQAARLLRFVVKLRALGVSATNPGDLLELTARDLRAIGIRGVALRRLRAALHNVSSRPLPAIAAPRYKDDAVASFLTRSARLTDSMAENLRTRHGVATLEDLAELDEDMLRDSGCKELHRRRLRAAMSTSRTQPRGQAENIGCGGSPDIALRRARLDHFVDGLRGQLGVVEAAHLLELKREDLIGLGFKTLHRRRFYQLVEPLRACPVDGKGSQLRKDMRRAVRAKTLQQLHLAVRAEQLSTMRKRPLSPPLLLSVQPLFAINPGDSSNESVAAAWAASWAPWIPRSAPVPATHPMGLQCAAGQLRLPGKVAQEMCLNPKDHLSKHVAKAGRWRDCEELVFEWNASSSRAGGEGDIFLELGANIGACTLEMLLLTSARVIAFEPSPINMFHLTRSLRLAASADAALHHRVVVFPVGAGDSAVRSKMVSDASNFGNTQLSESTRDSERADGDHALTQIVDVYPLDALFPQLFLPATVRLMKLDVQGFECKALLGAAALLLSGSVKTVMAETSKLLRRHKCSASGLRQLLRLAGFSIVTTGAEGVTTGSEVVTVARVNK